KSKTIIFHSQNFYFLNFFKIFYLTDLLIFSLIFQSAF
ncbi:hypothetical protein HP10700_05170, partial [Helicobacter pylori 10700]